MLSFPMPKAQAKAPIKVQPHAHPDHPLRRAAEAKGLAVELLARKLLVSERTLRRYFAGGRCSRATAADLESLFGVPLAALGMERIRWDADKLQASNERAKARRAQIVELVATGMSKAAVGRALGITRQRVVAACREEANSAPPAVPQPKPQ